MKILKFFPTIVLLVVAASAHAQTSRGCFSRVTGQPVPCSNPAPSPPRPAPAQPDPAVLKKQKEEADRIAAEAERQRQAEEARQKQEEFNLQRDKDAQKLMGGNAATELLGTSGAGDELISPPKPGLLDSSRSSELLDSSAKANAESEYFYALQTRTLEPMSDGGHPIDDHPIPAVGLHGLVGGTTWTYGFKWPHLKCERQCQDEIKKSLDRQLALFCSSQSDQAKCLRDGIPFSPEMYDMVVSMGSSHSGLEDLATRVLFDGQTFGEFSRQNKELFASLKGRQFETLDCHSNGAMLCLAALRSGDTKANVVRLFGPQMTPEAAKRWEELAHDPKNPVKLEIYINNGDPIPALSWQQPTPQTPVRKALTAAWFANPVTGPATLAAALFNTYLDSKLAVMDGALKKYGFVVMRADCDRTPKLECHSMLRYERLPPK